MSGATGSIAASASLVFVHGKVLAAVIIALAVFAAAIAVYAYFFMDDDKPRSTTFKNSPITAGKVRVRSKADQLAVHSPMKADELDLEHDPGGAVCDDKQALRVASGRGARMSTGGTLGPCLKGRIWTSRSAWLPLRGRKRYGSF